MKSLDIFKSIVINNSNGLKSGIYSVCSAHPDVIESAMLQALADSSLLVIEATSNQVDQFGGYTGMTPNRFVEYVVSIANKVNFPIKSLMLGGDHLGPNTWQKTEARTAMKNAVDLVAAYSQAGFKKIHLDASMFCADDTGDRSRPLANEIVASRVVELCKASEMAWKDAGQDEGPVYIIGTEVPVPGGAKSKEEAPEPTSAEDILATYQITKKAFLEAGLDEAWDRVVGIVCQPGVEYGDDQVFPYAPEKSRDLVGVFSKESIIYEAHSTDYQSEECLHSLVEDHFGILKVGPWLTYAYREAIFALSEIEQIIIPEQDRANVPEVLEHVMMTAVPNYWEAYYRGTPQELQFKRKYSFSDRSRYYWPNPEISKAVQRLFSNLSGKKIPLTLLSQFLPSQFTSVNAGHIENNPHDLVIDHIRDVLRIYARACGLSQT